MNLRNNYKKGMATVMSVAIVLGMMPVMLGIVTQVQAADASTKIILHDVDTSGDVSKGDIVDIGGEQFYVTGIDTDTSNITCFAVKGLSIEENRQSDNPDRVRFSGSAYTSYDNSEVKKYADDYGTMLNEEYGLDAQVSLVGYKDIGYVAPYAYSANVYSEKTWYQNGYYWTSSTYRDYGAWMVYGSQLVAFPGNEMTAMVRPSVTFAKSKIDEIVTDITAVDITGLDTPIAGKALDTEAISEKAGIQKIDVVWNSEHEVSETEMLSAKYNTNYTAEITVRAENGYVFTSATDVTINGEHYIGEIKDKGKTLVVTSKTSCTEKDKLLSITTPGDVTVANGTTYENMNLPANVNIITKGSTVTEAEVQWDTVTPISGSYDSSVLTEQSVTLEGVVVCPGTIDTNSVPLTTTITIKISAAETTGEPTIGDKSGWDEIKEDITDQVKNATSTSEKITINIDMNNTSKVDGTVIDAIKGKNVDIILDMGNGIAWTINGNSVTSGRVADIDLGVNKDTNAIPVDVINTITGQKSNIQISLVHNGEFGFTATLSIGLDSDNAGYYANLFYYNTETGSLEFMNACKIDAQGNASLTFTHASDYTIVIADKVMDGSDSSKTSESDTSTNVSTASVKTGDNRSMLVWIMLMIGVMIELAGVSRLGRKSRGQK